MPSCMRSFSAIGPIITELSSLLENKDRFIFARGTALGVTHIYRNTEILGKGMNLPYKKDREWIGQGVAEL